jgi:putative flippase GtrA
MFKQEFILRVLRFGIVGALVTGVFMALNWLFAPHLGPDLGYLAAYPLAVGLHFCLNKWWTFGDRGAVKPRQVSEYLVMMAVAFLIQTAVFKALIHFTATPSWLASGIATVAQMVLAFLFMQRRVFAPAASRPAGAAE